MHSTPLSKLLKEERPILGNQTVLAKGYSLVAYSCKKANEVPTLQCASSALVLPINFVGRVFHHSNGTISLGVSLALFPELFTMVYF